MMLYYEQLLVHLHTSLPLIENRELTCMSESALEPSLYSDWDIHMKPIMEIANKYKLRVVEDCAQSHGACFEGRTNIVKFRFSCIHCFIVLCIDLTK